MNTLEGSGVFEVHKLSTNYRSKQEVLDFANVSLRELETNRLSNIQLQANSLESPTAESFQAAITVDYHRVGKVSEFVPENLGNVIRQTVGPDYVTDRVAAGEQVAFLAATRREVTIMQEELTRLYPDHEVVSLVSDKTYATDIFSKYIKEFWADVLIVPRHRHRSWSPRVSRTTSRSFHLGPLPASLASPR